MKLSSLTSEETSNDPNEDNEFEVMRKVFSSKASIPKMNIDK